MRGAHLQGAGPRRLGGVLDAYSKWVLVYILIVLLVLALLWFG
jgi:hypothetical protein